MVDPGWLGTHAHEAAVASLPVILAAISLFMAAFCVYVTAWVPLLAVS